MSFLPLFFPPSFTIKPTDFTTRVIRTVTKSPAPEYSVRAVCVIWMFLRYDNVIRTSRSTRHACPWKLARRTTRSTRRPVKIKPPERVWGGGRDKSKLKIRFFSDIDLQRKNVYIRDRRTTFNFQTRTRHYSACNRLYSV